MSKLVFICREVRLPLASVAAEVGVGGGRPLVDMRTDQGSWTGADGWDRVWG